MAVPAYSDVLVGTDILIPSISEYTNEDIIGFYAERKVVAPDKVSAVQSAKFLVLQQWKDDGFKAANGNRDPALELDSIGKISLFRRIFNKVPNRGYTFFSKEYKNSGLAFLPKNTEIQTDRNRSRFWNSRSRHGSFDVAWHILYDPIGLERKTTNRRYTGQRRDAETGLWHYRRGTSAARTCTGKKQRGRHIMASANSMTDRFDWGSSVFIVESAPEKYRKFSCGSVCGAREIETKMVSEEFEELVGTVLYLVECPDGEAIEIPGKFLTLG